MTIKQFIEKAIEGGWNNIKSRIQYRVEEVEDRVYVVFGDGGYSKMIYDSEMFLDPKAWQAVGKIEKWETQDECWGCDYNEGATKNTAGWKVKMHWMIDALAQGKTIEEYLETL